jgi:hypothetical protein
LLSGELVIQEARHAGVPAFGHARRVLHGLLFFGIIVNVEMRGFENFEIEAFVLHFVAAKILGLGGIDGGAGNNDGQKNRDLKMT